jgi:hypothetical protein
MLWDLMMMMIWILRSYEVYNMHHYHHYRMENLDHFCCVISLTPRSLSQVRFFDMREKSVGLLT